MPVEIDVNHTIKVLNELAYKMGGNLDFYSIHLRNAVLLLENLQIYAEFWEYSREIDKMQFQQYRNTKHDS